MRINTLALRNFGVYAGDNRFEFTAGKPVVLVGGMNGRGKTTLMEGVLAALYGPNSFAFAESGFSTFGQYLKSKTNGSDKTMRGSITLGMAMDGSDAEDDLEVLREWDASGRRVTSEVTVKRNGSYDAFLTDNWAAYIEQVLPRALSSFFFFDGEKIAEMALDGSDRQIRESMRAILGVSVADALRSDLGRVVKRLSGKLADKPGTQGLEESRERVLALKREMADLDDQARRLDESASALGKALEILVTDLASAGGDALAQRAAHQEALKELDRRLDETSQSAAALAAGPLPLALLADRIASLRGEAEAARGECAMADAMTRIGMMAKDWDSTPTERAALERFLGEARGRVGKKTDRSEQMALCANHLATLQDTAIPAALAELDALREKRTSIKSGMAQEESYLSLNVDESATESLKDAMRETSDKLADVKSELSKVRERRSSANGSYIHELADYKRKVADCLKDADITEMAGRGLRYAALADNILESYSLKLQERKAGELAEAITERFGKLESKAGFVAKVDVDPKTLEISLSDGEGAEIPRETLSAGEKQLLVIATLWALGDCSRGGLPVIIDTPLARLDSAHRMAVAGSYFPNAAKQVIILSTDSEITGKYYDALKSSIADEFTLVYDDKTRSTSIVRGYFEEAAR